MSADRSVALLVVLSNMLSNRGALADTIGLLVEVSDTHMVRLPNKPVQAHHFKRSEVVVFSPFTHVLNPSITFILVCAAIPR